MRRVDIRMTADPEKTSAFHEAPAAAGTTLPVSAAWRATLDAAVGSGANQVYGISFTLADPSEAQKAVRQAAIDNAKSRATDYAVQAGASVGQVLQISETIGGPTPLVQFDAAAKPAAMSAAAVPVQTGELTVTGQVQVIYALQ